MKYIGYILLSVVLFTSCVRDEIPPCPPLKVMIGIKDKNYSNVDEVQRMTGLEYRVDENLPFRDYIQKLFYVMYNAETGEEVLVHHLHDVQGDAPLAMGYDIPGNLPFGKYVILVWGNILDEEPILRDKNYKTYDLHMDGSEGYDTYMTCDTLLYDATHHDYTVWLERVKGKLIIQVENLPVSASHSHKNIDGLYDMVDYQFRYSDQNGMEKQTDWNEKPEIVSKTVLAPSVREKGSTVRLEFFEGPDNVTPVLKPEAVNVTMRRNELTVQKYVYNPSNDSFSIYLLVDGAWSDYHDMEID